MGYLESILSIWGLLSQSIEKMKILC